MASRSVLRALGAATRGQENWAIRRRLRAELERALSQHARGRLVDVGCGRKPYEAFLRHRVTSHIGVDRADSLHGTARIDVIGDALATGLPSGSAETVLMSQVLEHLEDPLAALREARRLLVGGGHLILSTDFAWHLHEPPRDFFRFSPFALRYLFEASGFEVVELRPVCGTWLTVLQESSYGLRRLAGRHIALGIPAVLLGHLAQALGLALDRISFDPTLATGFVITGRRADDMNDVD